MVAARLAVQISAAEQRRVVAAHPPELSAYGLVLRGQDLTWQLRREANLHARRLFEQAAEIDPRYGRGYAGMSRTFNLAWQYRWPPKSAAVLETACQLALEAIRRDSLDGRGYSEPGFAQLYKKRHDESLAAYERAVELNPNDADTLARMAYAVTCSGEPRRAIDLLTRATRLNPYHPDWYLWHLGDAYFDLGDYAQTVFALKKMHDQSEAHRLLAASYAHLGQTEEARYHAEQILAVHPNFSIAHWRSVSPDRSREPVQRLVEGLLKAGLPKKIEPPGA